jgi:hypothetical protein
LTGLGVKEDTNGILGGSSSSEKSLVTGSSFSKLSSVSKNNSLYWILVFAVVGDKSVVLELIRVLSNSVIIETFLISGIPSKLSTFTEVVLGNGPTDKTLAGN